MADRPLLTAEWRDLMLLNFAVPADAVARLAPAGTEIDLHDNVAYVSVVGFQFDAVRLLGVPVPGHTRFPEINLRYYVRRRVGRETRRGVVFVREIVPRRAVALAANWLYNENYITRRMRSQVERAGAAPGVGDRIEYAWRTRGRRWNRLAARVAAPLVRSPAGSLEEFIVEHYWGYVRSRDGTTREYRVAHPPWCVARADEVVWDCDLAATYDPPLAEYLAAPPASALIAGGSPIQLYRGRKAGSEGDGVNTAANAH